MHDHVTKEPAAQNAGFACLRDARDTSLAEAGVVAHDFRVGVVAVKGGMGTCEDVSESLQLVSSREKGIASLTFSRVTLEKYIGLDADEPTH